MAEHSGFDLIHSSDHFHPWSHSQGQSGFSFSWLGAAMQATDLPFSVVCAPGQRYHPAIVAQAIATLAEMFPSRIDLEIGSGEAINECITGLRWPSKQQRNERLLESADIIRRLWAGEEVTYHGHIDIANAKLYTLPAVRPILYCAAISEMTCGWAGSWADGLLTTAEEIDATEKKLKAFRDNGGNLKPVTVQLSFSYAATVDEAIDGAYDQWRANLLGRENLAEISTIDQFEEMARSITRDDVANSIKSFTNIANLMNWVKRYELEGVDRITLHNIHPDQERFIKDYGSFKNG